MLKAVKALVNHEVIKTGNHSRESLGDYCEKFIYHWTPICVVNYSNRTFYTDNGGFNTSSTNRAISSYKYYFSNCGYTQVEKGEFTIE